MKILPVIAATGLALCLATPVEAKDKYSDHGRSHHRSEHRQYGHHNSAYYDKRAYKAWKKHQRKMRKHHRRHRDQYAYHIGAGLVLASLLDDHHYAYKSAHRHDISYYTPHSIHRYCRH